MATTQNTFTGNGSNLGPFSFTFKWLESTDIKVSVGGVLKTAGTHYNLQSLNYTTKTGGQVLFTAGNAPANGASIRIYRDTDDDALSAVFSSGSAIRAKDLNDNFTQNLYVTQEINNNAVSIDGSNPMVSDFDMGGYKITSLAAPVAGTDAANRSFVESVFSSEVPVFYRRWSKTAVGGETSLSGNDNSGIALSYVPGSEKVFINGALQIRGVDYLGTTGSTLTGIPALTAGDIIEVHSSSSYTVGTVPDGSVTNAKVDGAAGIQSNKLAFTTGTTTRTVESKLRDVISVKDFGALGIISDDATTAIQAAINSVPTGQEAPVGIYFPSGNYRITSNLTIANRTIIFYGDGPLASVIRPEPTVTNAFNIDSSGLAIKIAGLYRLGIREYGAAVSTTLIKVSNTTEVFFDNLYLQCSGRLIDYGPNNNFAMWNQIRGEAYGGMEAIRFRGGGGSISNMFIRKYDTSGTVGPTFWWQGSPLSTSLQVSDSSIGGSGCISRTAITSITSTPTTFTVNTGSAHGFVAHDWVVVRDASSAYYGTWLVASATSTSVTINSTLNAGTENPASAFLESLSACLYVDSSLGPINESIFNGVLFEGIDANGTAGKVGSASVWLDGRADTGSPIGSNIYGHRYSDCYFDVGQLGLVAQGIYVAGDSPIISGIRVADCQILGAKLGVYLRGTSGCQIIGNTILPVARTKADPNDDVDSAGIWINGLTTQNKGVQVANNIIGRQNDWRTDVLFLRNFDFGLRIDGNCQDSYFIGNHIYGGVEPVKLEGTGGATTLNTNTRAIVQGNMLATGAGGESTANRIPTIASASTITLGFNDIYLLSGTTTITAMNGGWVGRSVVLITLSALTLSGAGFNNSLKTVAGESVTATYDGAKWSLSSSTITPDKLSTGAPYWTSAGAVGFGTNNPQGAIHAVGAPPIFTTGGKSGSNTYLKLLSNDATNQLELQFRNLTNLAWEIQAVENNVSYRDIILQRNGGNVCIGDATPSAGTKLDINGDKVRLRTAKTPASATSSGNQGDICWDSSYIYVCTASNTWKRAALTTW
jgi:hypothetical protein